MPEGEARRNLGLSAKMPSTVVWEAFLIKNIPKNGSMQKPGWFVLSDFYVDVAKVTPPRITLRRHLAARNVYANFKYNSFSGVIFSDSVLS